MSVNVNRITLLGNVTKEVEVQYTKSGTPVANFTLVTNRNYQIEKNGQKEWQSIPEYHNVVFYGKVAEIIAGKLAKGSRMYVDGRMTYDKWTDKNGVQRVTAKVLGNNFVVLDKKEVQSGSVDEEQIEKDLIEAGQVGKNVDVDVQKEESTEKDNEEVNPDEIPF